MGRSLKKGPFIDDHLLKKVEELISSLETEIEKYEADFAKSNPSDEILETYNAKKGELDMALQEWEYLGTQLDK